MRWALAVLACVFASSAPAADGLLVFAAASLKNALDEVNRAYDAPVRTSYAASSALARQIERGAPADVFLSADADWMDYLERRGQVVKGTRRPLLGNRLVWVAPAGSPVPAEPLALLGQSGRLAIADPAHVPAGKYARAALEHAGTWDRIAGRLAPAENVRAALALVARGEAPLGVVYETDARAEPKVRVLARIDARLHPRIEYPAAAVRGSPGTARYLAFLASPTAAAIFEKHGFHVER